MGPHKALFDINSINLQTSLMIEASAGTGKTYSIIQIFFKAIITLEKNIDFRKILIVTFTKKATEEMEEKIRNEIEKAIQTSKLESLNHTLNQEEKKNLQHLLQHFEEIHISTIHSFCKSILKDYPFELKLPSHIEILESEDHILNEIFLNILLNIHNNSTIFNLDFFLKNHNIEKLFLYVKKFLQESQNRENFILDFINESIEFKDLINEEEEKWKLHYNENKNLCKFLKFIYKEIQKFKIQKGIVTYNDLIIHVYKALVENKKLLEKLQNQYTLCIIDEFQDTDSFQWGIFKKLFIEKEGNVLVVVGDPKQAIYGFRGADLYIYFQVKQELASKIQIKQLNINYRSTRNFIEASNSLFITIFSNFYKNYETFKNYQIEYKNVEPNYNSNSNTEYNKYKPINFIELYEENINLSRMKIGHKIVDIIFDLVENHNHKFSEIAILYRSSTELNFIKKIFLKRELPFVDYANSSVFNTLEAIAIEYLLYFLAHPEDLIAKIKFLLYYFVEIPYTQIETIAQNSSIFQEKISEWKQILEKRNWFHLFYKILEDTKFYYKYLAFPNYERKITNFEHLIEILVEIGTLKKLGIMELYNEFKKLKSITSEEYELKLDSDEDNEGKVQLLTIHKAKGLEFKTVFILGWYDAKSPPVGDSHNYKYYDFEKSLWNLCFFYHDQKEDKKQSIERETIFEELRLFYVAITRAKEYAFCVYPFIKSKPSYFFNAIGLKKESLHNNKIDFLPAKLEYKQKKSKEEQINSKTLENFYNILKDIETIDYVQKRYLLHSYSSLDKNLNKIKSAEFEESDFDEEVSKSEIETKITTNTSFDVYFPPGPNTGNCIHKIFQILSFHDFHNYKKNYIKKMYKKHIEYCLKFYSFNFNEEFEDFFYDFLNTILSTKINNEFSLKEISPATTKKEIGFLIKNLDSNNISKLANSYITGNIDLFFEHNQKFYLLDYKTTTLYNYDLETLQEYTDHHYKIQYLLYSYALYLWLDTIKKISLKEYLEKPIPGGIIYYYLRGYESNSKGIDFRNFLSFKKIKEELEAIL